MSEQFDAYHKWLGIPPGNRPPTFYQLLGTAEFETDPDVIEAAADQRMGHLRTYQSGTKVELSQKLLNEVSTARVTLLNPEKRAKYDAQLKESVAPASVAPIDSSSSRVASDPSVPLESYVATEPERNAAASPKSTLRAFKDTQIGKLLIGGITAAF